jgi:hypothetical protein
VQPDADPERPWTVRQTALVDLSQDLPRRLDRVAGGVGIVERRAEYCDVTLDEIRIEFFFPIDEATAQAFRSWGK